MVALGAELEHFIRQPFADELRGVSEVLSIDIGKIVLANLVYDLIAYDKSKSKWVENRFGFAK